MNSVIEHNGHAVELHHWSASYLGLDFKPHGTSLDGVSCYGLLNLVIKDRLDIDLPQYNPGFIDVAEEEEINHLLLHNSTMSHWIPVELNDIQEYDIITFHLRGIDSHVGIVINKHLMLHVGNGFQSRVERFDCEPWSTLKPKFFRYSREIKTHALDAHDGTFLRVIKGFNQVSLVEYLGDHVSILESIHISLGNMSDEMLSNIRVTISNQIIPRELWHRIYPKDWNVVIIRIVPTGIFNFLKIALTIAVVIGAAAISGGALGPAGAGLLGSYFGAGTVSAAVAAAGFALVGTLLINTLIPASSTSGKKDTTAYTINGFQNTINPDGVVPSVLGEFRFAPPFAALPYTQVIGNDRYSIAILLIGYGACEIYDPMIGNTPLSSFSDVSLEYRNGYPTGEQPVTLYPRQVIEDSDNPVEVTHLGGSITRTTASNCTDIEVEFWFSSGLVRYNVAGQKQPNTVNITVEYRLSGTSTWVNANCPPVTANTTKPFWRTFPIKFPTRAQYEIRITRITTDSDLQKGSSTYVDAFTISALRSFRPEYPLNYTKPMALVAIKMRATNQLNGTINNISFRCRRILLDYDIPTDTWVRRFSVNPAAIHRYIHQGPENVYPKADSLLDLDDYKAWYIFCNDRGLRYDNVLQEDNVSQDQILDDVAAAGRALKHDRGDKYSIIIDTQRTIFAGAITPHNSSTFAVSNPKVDYPDAFSVTFFDRTNLNTQNKRIIPWPTFVGTPTKIQEISLPGITDPTQLWIAARRRQLEATLRNDSYTVTMNIDQLAFQRGDAVLVNHYVLDSTQNSGAVIMISADSLVVHVDCICTMVAGKNYQCKFITPAGLVSTRSVKTISGSHNLLQFTDSGVVPSVGDLMMFGQLTLASIECIVKDIEPADDFTAQITLIDHAPTLDALTNAIIAPVWDGIIGNEVAVTPGIPSVPIIGQIYSGALASNDATASNPNPIDVVIFAGSGGVAAESYQLQFKLTSASVWTQGSAFLAVQGAYTIAGFSLADSVDIQVRGIENGVYSNWSATTTHVVGASNELIQTVTTFTAVKSGSQWQFTWGLSTQDPTKDYAQIQGVQISYGSGHDQAYSSLTTVGSGIITFSPFLSNIPSASGAYTFGIVAVAFDGTVSAPTLINADSP